jgi:enoyl-CoA hydratase/carnithine racemase
MDSNGRISAACQDGVAVITIDKPARRNALDVAMRMQLAALLGQLMHEDASCRCVVLTGAGSHFCSGADVSEMSTPTVAESRRRMDVVAEIVDLIVAGPKPVIAAVEGFAYGAGFSLAMVTDCVVAATNARFAGAFAKVGLLPDVGMLWSLGRRVGDARARALMMLASEIDGREAGLLGAADRVVEPGAALAQALALARAWASLPPARWAAFKRAALMPGAAAERALARSAGRRLG